MAEEQFDLSMKHGAGEVFVTVYYDCLALTAKDDNFWYVRLAKRRVVWSGVTQDYPIDSAEEINYCIPRRRLLDVDDEGCGIYEPLSTPRFLEAYENQSNTEEPDWDSVEYA